MEALLLVADIGNTRMKWALFVPTAPEAGLPQCRGTLVIPPGQPWDWQLLFDQQALLGGKIEQVWLSGSQQERLETLINDWPTELPTPQVLRSALQLPIPLGVDYPDKVGVDRVLNAVAVNRLRTGQAPAVIVDAGTAITIDAVSETGRFLGGAILPGYELEAHALHDYTSLLPFIPMEEIIGEIPVVIGKNTHAALRSGLIWGQVGAVNEIVSRMNSSLQAEGNVPPQYFLTGGAAPLLEPHLREQFRLLPQLTLQGLACLVES